MGDDFFGSDPTGACLDTETLPETCPASLSWKAGQAVLNPPIQVGSAEPAEIIITTNLSV
jgi:hypothetical protein